MIIGHHMMNKIIATLLMALSLSAQSYITLPEDSVSFGLFVVNYQSKEFEQGTILNYPTCLEVDTVLFPLELEVQPAADFGYTIMTYPCTGDTVFHGTYVWMGQGELYKPDSFIPADSFYVQEDSIREPQSIQYWRETGISLVDTVEILAADSAWNAIKNLNVVRQFANYPYQVVIYRYPPSLGALDPSVAKWIVFLYRNPTSPIITYPGPAFSLSFNNSEYEFPVVVDVWPRTYRIDAEVLGLVGENAPTEWTFTSIHQSENQLSFYFDKFVFGPGDTINWSDTTSHDMESMDPSDHMWQTFMYPGGYSPPTFSDANTGNPSGFIIRTNNSPQQLSSEDTLSFAINGYARSDLRQFYPLALGNKWKWAQTYHHIDSVSTEEVIAVSELADFTEYVIERRGHDYQLYGGLATVDTISKYTHVLDRANIYSAPSSEAISVSFSDSNPEQEIEFLYQLIDDSPALLLREGDEFGSSTWRYGVGLSSQFMDPGAVKSLIGYQINGASWGDLSPIQVSINEHPVLPSSFSLHAYPNPFNPTATISYTLPHASNIKLTVFNVSGQTVLEMVDSNQAAGAYQVHWNGLNHSGKNVSTGMYLIQLQTENHSQFVKVLYLK
ncbi:MAG: T9SS type A sorting domain-containing protein [Candidatus Marinimicrobia bacterium]|nr:T9SS type A sorting domain-containing protein [Candidatus Neomarinimicrobiota bacterium]